MTPWAVCLLMGVWAIGICQGLGEDTEKDTKWSLEIRKKADSLYEQCGVSRQCFGWPADCIQSKSCVSLLAYGVQNGDSVPVVLYGNSTNTQTGAAGWIGFGLSMSGKMNSSAVVQCVRYTDGTFDVVAAYNAPDRTYEPLSDVHLGISGIAPITYVDGYVQCSFNLAVQRTVKGVLYDLTQPYAILLANGGLVKNSSRLSYHDNKAVVATEVVVAQSNNGGFIYAQCGATRQCFGVPDSCIANQTCNSLLAYGAATEGADSIPVVLYGETSPEIQAQSPAFWIGFGLSITGGMYSPFSYGLVTQSQETAVIQCVSWGNDTTDVWAAYNPPVSDPNGHLYQALADRRLGITDVSASILSGFASCSFNLDLKRNVSGVVYDLSTPYTVLLGRGYANASTGDLRYHLSGAPKAVARDQYLACGNQCAPTPCLTGHCFGVPRSCEQLGRCDVLVSWTAPTAGSRTVKMSLTGNPFNASYANNFWIGFAVRPEGSGNKMSNAAVVQCARYPDSTNALVAAYNFPITGNEEYKYQYQILQNKTYGISDSNIAFVDGQLACTFQLDIDRTINGTKFNLADYLYIMAGSGYTQKNDSTGEYRNRKHLFVPLVSRELIAVACTANCTIPTPSPPTVPVPTGQPTGEGQFGIPKDCVKSDSCLAMVTYGQSKKNSSRISLVLNGKSGAQPRNQFYVALGVTSTQTMEHAFVMECVAFQREGRNDQGIFASYNGAGYKNTRIPANGLYLQSSNYSDGALECHFEADIVQEIVEPGNSQSLTFDLSQSYYLLLAHGGLQSGSLNDKAHHDLRAFSDDKVTLSRGETPTSPPPANPLYDQCGVSRQCFGLPVDCIQSKSCVSLFAYGVQIGATVPVVLYGNTTNKQSGAAGWVGFGLSISGKMNSSAVVQCVRYADETLDVVAAYNTPDRVYETLAEVHLGITDIAPITYVDGYVQCSFNLAVQRTVKGVLYDLTQPYAILLANGGLVPGSKNLSYHENKAVVATQVTVAQSNNGGFIYAQCNVTRQCFGVPDGCIANQTCNSLLAYGAATEGADSIPVVLYGETSPEIQAQSPAFWIGFGLSITGGMQETAVIQCVSWGNDTTDVVAAYNPPVSDPNGHVYQALADSRLGITDVSASILSGFASCSFNLDLKRNVSGVVYDLSTPYTVLLGRGYANASTGELRYHLSGPPAAVARSQVLACGNQCQPTPPNNDGTFGIPNGCVADDCQAIATYGLSKTNASRVSLVLRGKPGSLPGDGFYVALGVANSQKMGHAFVMECVSWKDGSVDKQELFSSYNTGDDDNDRDNKPIPMKGLYSGPSSWKDGTLECQFEADFVHQIGSDIEPSNGHNKTFDFTQSYFLLLARGGLKSPDSHVKMHHDIRGASENKVILSAGQSANAGDTNIALKKTHAILMVIAWNLLVAFGILMARQTKNMWPDRAPFGGKVWFITHRAVNVHGGAADRDQFHHHLRRSVCGHFPTTPPARPNRPYFNYFHWTVGYSTHLMSAVTMFLGAEFTMTAMKVHSAAGYILIASFAANLLIQLLLEIHRYRQKGTILQTSYSKEELTPTEHTHISQTVTTSSEEPLHPEDKLRQALLSLDALLIGSGTIAVIALIAAA
ncbi:putative ferric-chelate reductase 1 [Hypsibius exemplaris]|uniref:Ferric-chelate reductase 1 n=1 Tax=Hypsibius exemplaris TaxID=2072580 RepID=A0A9X6NID1_HYPEX|nr:putative ferric-chelate reductase 1 [Hypsibius exemplaris]